jgi:hypothetical protein
MSDEIKPVPPAHPVVPRRHAIHEQPPQPRRHAEALAPQEPRSEGYSLANITVGQAGALLEHPLLAHPKALSNEYMAKLKLALEKKKAGAAEATDDVILSTAKQAVDSLVAVTYSPGTPATPADLLALVRDFHSAAGSVGESRSPRLG